MLHVSKSELKLIKRLLYKEVQIALLTIPSEYSINTVDYSYLKDELVQICLVSLLTSTVRYDPTKKFRSKRSFLKRLAKYRTRDLCRKIVRTRRKHSAYSLMLSIRN